MSRSEIRRKAIQRGQRIPDFDDLKIKFFDFVTTPSRVLSAQEVDVFTFDATGLPLPDNHYMCLPLPDAPRRNDKTVEPRYCHTEPFLSCDCPDHEWNDEVLCKHLVAALLYEGNEQMYEILDDLDYYGEMI